MGVPNEHAATARVGTCFFDAGASTQLKLDAARQRGLAGKPRHGQTEPARRSRVADQLRWHGGRSKWERDHRSRCVSSDSALAS